MPLRQKLENRAVLLNWDWCTNLIWMPANVLAVQLTNKLIA